MNEMYAIIGLGNPGKNYENTRHNVGFEVVDLLSRQYQINISRLKHKALIGDGIIQGDKVLLVKPQTFMNSSGESVREIIKWYKIPYNNVIIIYDDIDLEVGKLRVRPKGGAGTHNGMRSVIYQIKTEEFPRVRIGIDKPPEGWNLAKYVLGKFGPDDRKLINEVIDTAADAVVTIVKAGVNISMNKFNK